MNTISNLLNKVREKKPIAVLTAYDSSIAAMEEKAGVDAILVGDSLGMVVQGRQDTLTVRIEDIIYHSANVRRGARNSFLIADMPFMSTATMERALDAAQKLIQLGKADMVKIEGGDEHTVDLIEKLVQSSVPVCAHLGLLPQKVRLKGGYAVAGKAEEEAQEIFEQALSLRKAGAQMLVLECVPDALAAKISKSWGEQNGIVIGIGAGADCHGQVLVCYDVLGISNYIPTFAYDFLQDSGSIQQAFCNYVESVSTRKFPKI